MISRTPSDASYNQTGGMPTAEAPKRAIWRWS
jgi:hypothetical protein